MRKTTIELPDDLMVEVKKAAAERHTTIRDLVERGLRREIAAGSPERPGIQRIRWVTGDGGLPPGMDLSDRAAMHAWILGDPTHGRD
jgi:hypothetical protein